MFVDPVLKHTLYNHRQRESRGGGGLAPDLQTNVTNLQTLFVASIRTALCETEEGSSSLFVTGREPPTDCSKRRGFMVTDLVASLVL